MYGVIVGGGGIGGAGAAALANTGLDTLSWVVAATTLVAAGLSIWKLAPRRNRS